MAMVVGNSMLLRHLVGGVEWLGCDVLGEVIHGIIRCHHGALK